MQQVQLSDAAFRAYERRAKAEGLSVDEFLDRSAPLQEFILTNEMRAAIEEGLKQAEEGKLYSLDEVRERLDARRAEWLRESP